MAETDYYGIEQRRIFSIVQTVEALQPVCSRRYQKYIDLLKSFPVSLQPVADKSGLAKSQMILVRLVIFVLSCSILAGKAFAYCISPRFYCQHFHRHRELEVQGDQGLG